VRLCDVLCVERRTSNPILENALLYEGSNRIACSQSGILAAWLPRRLSAAALKHTTKLKGIKGPSIMHEMADLNDNNQENMEKFISLLLCFFLIDCLVASQPSESQLPRKLPHSLRLKILENSAAVPQRFTNANKARKRLTRQGIERANTCRDRAT
jgi:hypothetical protein